MEDRKLLRIGVGGAVFAAIFCFTPLLIVLLGAVGLSAVVGWLDYALVPALVLSVALVVYTVVRRRRRASAEPSP